MNAVLKPQPEAPFFDHTADPHLDTRAAVCPEELLAHLQDCRRMCGLAFTVWRTRRDAYSWMELQQWTENRRAAALAMSAVADRHPCFFGSAFAAAMGQANWRGGRA